MDCRDVLERLSEYRDGSLPAAVAEKIAGHIRECGDCSGVDRSLAAVRDLLRALPTEPAPPGLLARVREAVSREEGGATAIAGEASPPAARSFLSRVRLPLEAAAAVLLVASIWWYQKGSPPSPVSQGSPALPAAVAPGPAQAPDQPALRAKSPASPPVRERRSAPLAARTPSPGGTTAPGEAVARKEGVASLPPGTPEPKARAWTASDLPLVPVYRAGTDSERISPAIPSPAREMEGGPAVLAAPPSRLLRPLPYGREVVLDVTPELRNGVEERIVAAARRSGGSVERIESNARDGSAAVRVLLPEPGAPVFLEELDRIGKVPPEGKPAGVDLPAGPFPGTVAYTVRIRVR